MIGRPFMRGIRFGSSGQTRCCLLCILAVLISYFCASGANARESANPDFFIATHYYGLAEYSYPINYLNSVRERDIESDLKKLKDMGFNAIILLASWGEFQPEIGAMDKDAYRKINRIIRTASSLNLKVMIRIPYLWSLEGVEIRERIAYALIDYGTYQSALLDFLKEFEKVVILNNGNIVMKFGSWEDFYVLRDFFFSGESVVSDRVRRAFSRDTGLQADKVEQNGENYDFFLNWADDKIRQLTKEIGNYGYEIRTDADPFRKNNKFLWHSHSSYYKNESNGSLVAYWAPYFGQQNNGESINADQAISSFSWMLDSIEDKSSQLPFIDQLNFYDNSPGTENNAKIGSEEYWPFFKKLSPILTERTTGYALWTIRDYSHNVIFNPSFSEGLKGWNTSNGVSASSNGVSISHDGYLFQVIKRERLRVLEAKNPILIMEVASGNAEVEVDSIGKFELLGAGRHEITIPFPALSGDLKIIVRPHANSTDKLHIDWLGLFGHAQIGRVLDRSGNEGDFYDLIQRFNFLNAKDVDQQCRGFKNVFPDSPFLARGIFPDDWSAPQFEFCLARGNSTKGFRLFYVNPSPEKRMAKITMNGLKETSLNLDHNDGEIHLCTPRGTTLSLVSISVSPPFIPSLHSKLSPDLRNLGVFIKKIEECECP